MVNSTQQWPTEEIHITNCLCMDGRPSVCVFLCFASYSVATQTSRSLCSLQSFRTGSNSVFANARRDCCCGRSSPLPFSLLSFAHTDSLACLPPTLFAWIKQFSTALMRAFQTAKSSRKQLYSVFPFKRLQLMSFCWNTITEKVLISGSQRGTGLMIRDVLVHTLVAFS